MIAGKASGGIKKDLHQGRKEAAIGKVTEGDGGVSFLQKDSGVLEQTFHATYLPSVSG